MKSIMMKKINILFFLALLLFSCVDEKDVPIVTPEPEDGYINLTVKLPGVATPTSYVLPEEDENLIEEIDILVFGQEGNQEKYLYKVEGTTILDVSGNANKKTFKAKLKYSNTNVRLVVIANSRSSMKDFPEGTLKENVLNDLVFEASNVWPTPSGGRFKGFPMWGETASVSINPSEKLPEVSLIRALAKIDVVVDAESGPSLGFGNKFKLHQVSVHNFVDKGYISPNKDGFQNNKVTQPNVSSAWSASSRKDYSVIPSSSNINQEFFREIYVPESKPESTCIIVAAYYDNSAQPRFYRLDFANEVVQGVPQYLPILRNHRYYFNITGLNNSGYATYNEAANNKGSNLVYDLKIVDERINNIHYNNQYYLGTNEGTLRVENFNNVKNAGDLIGTTTTEILVTTNDESGWKATVDNNYSSWLSIDKNSGGSAGTTEIIKVTLEPLVNAFERVGYVDIVAGSLKNTVKIVQRAGANCYVVKTGETINIPITMSNADGTERIKINSDCIVETLWESQNSVSDIKFYAIDTDRRAGYIRVTGGSKGNALVVIRDNSSKEILWSWHVWVTNQSIRELEYRDNIFMDRNLGAVSNDDPERYGFLYQWGRKDPFPGAFGIAYGSGTIFVEVEIIKTSADEVTKIESVTLANNFEEARKNPNTFYISSYAPYFDWYGTNNSNNSLWDRSGNKTPYDPCPPGWKVPTSGSGNNSAWFGLNSNNSAVDWNKGWQWHFSIYPATGKLDGFDGKLKEAGSTGYLWSASPSSSQAYGFKYGSTDSNINTSYTGNRVDGHAVRCAKEILD